MRKLALVGAALTLALAVPSAARAADNQFAVGSAKTEVEIVDGLRIEHASFSAHSTGTGCEAKGHVVYSGTFGFPQAGLATEFEGEITELVVVGQRVWFGARVTRYKSGFDLGPFAGFWASDSGLSGGTGDTFALESFRGVPTVPLCDPPVLGTPITKGNIVIKSNPLP